jgi:hypothetical protein
MTTKILYVCQPCHENAPEGCGHGDPTDLRVLPDGTWVCGDCHQAIYDGEYPQGEYDAENPPPAWADLPAPPVHAAQS